MSEIGKTQREQTLLRIGAVCAILGAVVSVEVAIGLAGVAIGAVVARATVLPLQRDGRRRREAERERHTGAVA